MRLAPVSFLAALLALATAAAAQPLDPKLFAELRFRMIGPHRGGRTVAAVGVPGRPDVFYIGVNNGGVWKSNDYGRVWRPIFDAQPTGSIGAIAVAPSRPSIVYVGSGEGLQRPDLSTGDGVYKSTDGGETWEHLGLRDGQQVPQLIVDPGDPERLFVAVLGHPYGPNRERGVYRSRDGGKSFEQVLGRGEDTGAIDLAFEPGNPNVVYAALWAARQAPWEINGSWQVEGSGLYKSEDGGDSWRRLSRGLPDHAAGLGRIGLGVSASRPKQLFALVDAPALGGLYRSDDAGESFERVNRDPRIFGRGGDFAEVKVDPQDADTVYVANVAAWKSTDGGKSFAGFRGAPGGDDYHRLWIHPENPRTMLMAGDQGAIVTVNGGDTWSSWYNQPTAQFYHVSTDDQFPYRVYGAQQESGSVGISSRGADGQITFREWHPVGVEEYGYVAPDPLDPDVVYGGRVTRYDRRTGQVQDVAPQPLRGEGYRVVRTQPLLFSPVDPKLLLFASNVLWKTTDGGANWTAISPDLTRPAAAPPGKLGVFAAQDPEQGKHRGVIYTIAPSYREPDVIWVGTDDGLIQRTLDGGRSWTDVSPPELEPWAKVSILDASHFDRDTAYAAVNTFRLDDLRPHIYRTHDGGKRWAHITNGIPEGGVVNVVREDPVRRGLLFAGTERAVYFSIDDGEHWQSLRLNMPATSIRDLVVKGDDLVVATHGRSFWILDDLSPLRQLESATGSRPAFLFRPAVARRVRWNTNPDTPLPRDEPAGENPPDGAVIDYYLGTTPSGPVTLEILDAAAHVVRSFASDAPPEPPVEGRNIPDYWIRPPRTLSARAGQHRFVFDLHYPPPEAPSFEYPIEAVVGNTPRAPMGPWLLPGEYTVRLTLGGQSLSEPLTVEMDPRVKTTPADLRRQFELSVEVATALGQGKQALGEAQAVRRRLAELKGRAKGARLAEAIQKLDDKASALESSADGLTGLGSQLARLYGILQGADVAPTAATVAAIAEKRQALARSLARLTEVRTKDWPMLARQLKAAGLPELDR